MKGALRGFDGGTLKAPAFEIHLRLTSSVYPNTRPKLDKVWLMIFTSESNLPPVEIGWAKIRDSKVGVSDAFVQSGEESEDAFKLGGSWLAKYNALEKRI